MLPKTRQVSGRTPFWRGAKETPNFCISRHLVSLAFPVAPRILARGLNVNGTVLWLCNSPAVGRGCWPPQSHASPSTDQSGSFPPNTPPSSPRPFLQLSSPTGTSSAERPGDHARGADAPLGSGTHVDAAHGLGVVQRPNTSSWAEIAPSAPPNPQSPTGDHRARCGFPAVDAGHTKTRLR
jgi:hypothetical protein